MEPRVKCRQTRGEWEKEFRIRASFERARGGTRIKMKISVGQLHYAIHLLFDILIPKKAG